MQRGPATDRAALPRALQGAGKGLPWQRWGCGRPRLKAALPHSQGAPLLCSTSKTHLAGRLSEADAAVCSGAGSQGQLSPEEMPEPCLGAAFSGLRCWERIPRQGKPACPAGAAARPASALRRHVAQHQSTDRERLAKKKKGGGVGCGDSLPSYFACSSAVNRQKSSVWAMALTLTPRKASAALGREGPAVAES